MKILIFSDIHGDQRSLEQLMEQEADYYFAAGDIVTWSRGLDRAGRILSRRAGKVYVLPGNHESEEAIAGMCERHGLHTFHGKILQVNGYQIAGLGYSNRTPFHTPGEYTEQELARRLAPFADLRPLILICHCPPKNTPLDRMHFGLHRGSTAIRSFIDLHQPEYFFCGHIHEAHGASARIGATHAFNPGKQGYLLDFDKLEA